MGHSKPWDPSRCLNPLLSNTRLHILQKLANNVAFPVIVVFDISNYCPLISIIVGDNLKGISCPRILIQNAV
jgi:hypothetical protein